MSELDLSRASLSESNFSNRPTAVSRVFESPEEYLVHLARSNRFTRLQDYLTKNPDTDILKMKDNKFYTCKEDTKIWRKANLNSGSYCMFE